MTELELRQKVVNTAKAWLGAKESDGSFKPIIDLYNTINPLPVGYKVKYTDEWCATYVSAVGFKAGLKGIILPECSCSRMIALYKAKGRWQEKDSYRPSIGDIVMYDWQDGTNYATTDNTGNPDHVGIVTGINGDIITIIEGNKGQASMVAYRNLKVNGRYIRGWCLPDYASLATKKEDKEEVRVENRFAYLKDVPPSYRGSVEKAMRKGYLGGYSDPDPNSLEDNLLDLSDTFCRVLKVMDNAGLLG